MVVMTIENVAVYEGECCPLVYQTFYFIYGLGRVVLDVIHYSIQLQFLSFGKIVCLLSSSVC